MMMSVSSCNFSIKKSLFMAVGGFDEELPRMVDFELGYRLFRYGAKIYFSHEPFAVHLRAPGGSRQKPNRHDRLVAALYIHKKHFPGWITKQFMLKQMHDSIWNRRILTRPWNPVVRLYKLIRANRIVKKKLHIARAGETGGRSASGLTGSGAVDR
jgi:GT2 family glycosyltransferase